MRMPSDGYRSNALAGPMEKYLGRRMGSAGEGTGVIKGRPCRFRQGYETQVTLLTNKVVKLAA